MEENDLKEGSGYDSVENDSLDESSELYYTDETLGSEKVGFWTIPRMRREWGYGVPFYLNTLLLVAALSTFFSLFFSIPRLIVQLLTFQSLSVPEGPNSTTDWFRDMYKAEYMMYNETYAGPLHYCFGGDVTYFNSPVFKINEFFRILTFAARARVGSIEAIMILVFYFIYPLLFVDLYGLMYLKNLVNLTSVKRLGFEDFSIFFKFSKNFGIFKDTSLADEFRDFLVEKGFSVESVMFLPSDKKYLELCKKIEKLEAFKLSASRYIPLMNQVKARRLNPLPMKIESISEKIDEIEQQKNSYDMEGAESSFCVVTFRTPVDAARAYKHFRCPYKYIGFFAPLLRLLHIMRWERFKGSKVRVRLSDKSSSINWENFRISRSRRAYVNVLIYMISFCFIVFLVNPALFVFYIPTIMLNLGPSTLTLHESFGFIGEILMKNPLFDMTVVLIVFILSFSTSRFISSLGALPRYTSKADRRTALMSAGVYAKMIPILVYYIVYMLLAISFQRSEDTRNQLYLSKCAMHRFGGKFFFLGVLPIFVSQPIFPALITIVRFLVICVTCRFNVSEIKNRKILRSVGFNFMHQYTKMYTYMLIGYWVSAISPFAYIMLTVYFWIFYVMERINFMLFYSTEGLSGRFPESPPKFPYVVPIICMILFPLTFWPLSDVVYNYSSILVIVFVLLFSPLVFFGFSAQPILYWIVGPKVFKRIFLWRLRRKNVAYDSSKNGYFSIPYTFLSSSGPRNVEDWGEGNVGNQVEVPDPTPRELRETELSEPVALESPQPAYPIMDENPYDYQTSAPRSIPQPVENVQVPQQLPNAGGPNINVTLQYQHPSIVQAVPFHQDAYSYPDMAPAPMYQQAPQDGPPQA